MLVAEATVESLKTLKWGVVANTTALPMVQSVIAPSADPLLYDDNVNVIEAMKSNQIDAAIFDLPTALYLSAVVLEDGVILGQFPADRSENPDMFGLLMEEGNPLRECVNEAIAEMTGRRVAGGHRGRVAAGEHRRSAHRISLAAIWARN